MIENKLFNKIFAARGAACYFVLLFFMLFCVLRLFVIASGDYAAVGAAQSAYKIPLAKTRGTIFDCNMVPITNRESYILAAATPTDAAIAALKDTKENAAALKQLKNGKPAVFKTESELSISGVSCTRIYKRADENTPAVHLIGYTDSTGHGVSGLEKAYDELLFKEQTPAAVFTVNGAGTVLKGISPRFENAVSPFDSGVVSTIDINIQSVAERAAKGIESGAVVVAEAKTGKLRALVSMPQYNPEKIDESLNAPNSPMLNKALSAFSVGSVFKPCVAAAALENNVPDFSHNCTGSSFIIDRSFNCHKRDGHGEVTLKSALAFSCNTFFYSFAERIGAENICKAASMLNFGTRISIADNLNTAAGNLPRADSIANASDIANLSIGQGELLLSPVSMLPLYCAIANGGEYRLPTAVEGTVENGKFTAAKAVKPTRVMSKTTADILLDCLSSVVQEGTGAAASPKTTTAAGKTATAQTGRYNENGVELTNSWFCGMFPRENPQYVVIVLAEGESKTPTAEVFAEIAEGIVEVR